MVDGPSYNRSLVRRGEILFSYDFLDSWDSDLERMNENKKGKPFTFPDIYPSHWLHTLLLFHLLYRQTEEIINSTGKTLPANPPSYVIYVKESS